MMQEVDMGGGDDAATRGHSLPVPKYNDGGEWRDHARCRKEGNDVFYAQMERGGSVRSFQAQIEMAKQICAECPVRLKCLNYAIRNDTTHGVWGGVNMRTLKSSERKALLAMLDKISA